MTASRPTDTRPYRSVSEEPSLDDLTLLDLTRFAHAEDITRDVEPWADLLRDMLLRGMWDREFVIWLMVLYNTYDNFSSAWQVAERWPSPQHWLAAKDRDDARNYRIEQERRNLHGGRVNLRHESYARLVGEGSQMDWFGSNLEWDDPGSDFERLNKQVRGIVQVGRQSAYEFCEFVAKVLGFPVDSTDGHLWESSGPRQSIEALYKVDKAPSLQWLNETASEVKLGLAIAGVPLSWWDFETIICDFKVGVRGRYHVGKHLQALKEEILDIPDVDDRMAVLDHFEAVVPEPWSSIPPGIDKSRLTLYRDTGIWITEPWW